MPACYSPTCLPVQTSVKDRADGGGCTSSSSIPEAKDDEAGSSSGGEGGEGDSGAAASAGDPDETPPWSWRKFGACCGSGLLMSVAYLVSGAGRGAGVRAAAHLA